jgi:hypothetical protein
MKNRIVFTYLIILLVMSSCQNYDKPISIKNEKFEVVLPGFVQKEELAEDAALEYANRFTNYNAHNQCPDEPNGRFYTSTESYFY